MKKILALSSIAFLCSLNANAICPSALDVNNIVQKSKSAKEFRDNIKNSGSKVGQILSSRNYHETNWKTFKERLSKTPYVEPNNSSFCYYRSESMVESIGLILD